MILMAKSPDQLKADRLAREAREKEVLAERTLTLQAQWSVALRLVGGVMMLIGLWLLAVSPGIYGDVVNLQKLYIGQTSALAGTILLAAGVLLKFVG